MQGVNVDCVNFLLLTRLVMHWKIKCGFKLWTATTNAPLNNLNSCSDWGKFWMANLVAKACGSLWCPNFFTFSRGLAKLDFKFIFKLYPNPSSFVCRPIVKDHSRGLNLWHDLCAALLQKMLAGYNIGFRCVTLNCAPLNLSILLFNHSITELGSCLFWYALFTFTMANATSVGLCFNFRQFLVRN